jgi:hypothetical protein
LRNRILRARLALLGSKNSKVGLPRRGGCWVFVPLRFRGFPAPRPLCVLEPENRFFWPTLAWSAGASSGARRNFRGIVVSGAFAPPSNKGLDSRKIAKMGGARFVAGGNPWASAGRARGRARPRTPPWTWPRTPSAEVHGRPWTSIEIRRRPWTSMEGRRNPQTPIETHGRPSKSADAHYMVATCICSGVSGLVVCPSSP